MARRPARQNDDERDDAAEEKPAEDRATGAEAQAAAASSTGLDALKARQEQDRLRARLRARFH